MSQSRFEEIRKKIESLNMEAEKLLLEKEDHGPEGSGKCGYNVCACQGYVQSSDTPAAICGRSRCGHYASDHGW